MTDLSIYINRKRRQIREKQRFSKLDEIRNVGKIRESNLARQIIGMPHKAAAQVLPAKLPFRVSRRPFWPADTNVEDKKNFAPFALFAVELYYLRHELVYLTKAPSFPQFSSPRLSFINSIQYYPNLY